MLQENLFFIILIAIVGVVALTVNYIISTREQQEEAKDKRLKWLKAQMEHINQALAILREADCKPGIISKLDEHAIALLEEISILAPDSELYETLARQKAAADQMLPNPGAFESDRALKRAQIYFNFAEKIIIRLARAGKLTITLGKTYQQELYCLKITLVVDAHIHQGKKLLTGEDRMTALTHFKHAKAVLLRAQIPQTEKQTRMKQIQNSIELIQPRQARPEGTLADRLDRLL